MKAVIFDMDGVLFDTERLAVKAWDEIGVKCGLGPVGYMVYETLGRTTPESVKIFKSRFGDSFNNSVFQKEYREWLNAYYENNPVPVKSGVKEILTYLKENGYKTAVASSSTKDSVYHHLDNAGITDYFNEIVCGDSIEKSKPEPDIYIKACELLGEAPQTCYAVEDSESGLKSARGAGCKVIYIPDLYEAEGGTLKCIDYKFESLNEFLEHIKKT
ncbi:MAG: HAD family phosphatase [Eubacterium sp.]|nr:HAD family phosphatase [Eubacterium sp.]